MTRRTEPSDVLVLPRSMATKLAATLDPAAFGQLVRLYELADRTWPAPAALPRWADQQLVDELHGAGHIALDGEDFTCRHVELNRARQKAWHAAGGKARAESAARDGGKFTSDQQDTSRPPAAPAAAGQTPADGDGDGDGDGGRYAAVPNQGNARANGADGPPGAAGNRASPGPFYASDGKLGRRHQP